MGNHHRVPDLARSRDLTITGSDWHLVLAMDMGTLSLLFSKANLATLPALHRSTPPELGFEVLVGEDVTSLWLGGARLSAIATKEKR